VGNSSEQTTQARADRRTFGATRNGTRPEFARLDIEDPSWLSFVAGKPEAEPFHRAEWTRLLGDCYGYETFALAFHDRSGRILAGLPVVEISGMLRRRRWVALPFTDACAPLVEPEFEDAFALELARFRAASDVPALEVRTSIEQAQSFRTDVGTIHRLDLTLGIDAVHSGFSRSRVRPEIKRAAREGVAVRRASRAADVTTTFYDLHVGTRRRQGVPVQPRRFFELLWQRVLAPGLGFALIAELEGRPVAGAIFLAWNGTVIYKYAASDEAFRWARPNHLVLWEAIRSSCETGAHTLDFGKTDPANEGLRKFKSGWGAREEPLTYTTFADETAPPRNGNDRLSGRLLGTVIRRSPPWVCRAIGARAYRYAA
jgi:CelD/BcsL family acetyltransferase involved in cellulose biosynthesis